jgi:hypothetical protein
MQSILTIDSSGSLAAIPLSIQEIAEIAELMAKRDLLQRRIDASPMKVAAQHLGRTVDARRRQFADRDRRKIEVDRVQVRARVLQKQPLPGASSGPRKTWTEMALLRNEFSKQKRFTPVRPLLARAGRSIQALKPCFMMSPLSGLHPVPKTPSLV